MRYAQDAMEILEMGSKASRSESGAQTDSADQCAGLHAINAQGNRGRRAKTEQRSHPRGLAKHAEQQQ